MSRKLPSFANQDLFELALTHRSYTNENLDVTGDNERLEFLGDAVLGFAIAQMLYSMYPSMNEAQLTHLRSRLVDEKQLGKLGAEVGLGKKMRLGKGADKDGGRKNPSLLNDTFEAVLGAYFLDAGIQPVHDYIIEIFAPLAKTLVENSAVASGKNIPAGVEQTSSLLDRSTQATFIDRKNALQQWSLANHQVKPQYRIIAETGCDRDKQFTAQVSVLGQVYGVGVGNRKKEAEKKAAQAALDKIQSES